jgi:hypothetical protein
MLSYEISSQCKRCEMMFYKIFLKKSLEKISQCKNPWFESVVIFSIFQILNFKIFAKFNFNFNLLMTGIDCLKEYFFECL